jgi:hypothetical protein
MNIIPPSFGLDSPDLAQNSPRKAQDPRHPRPSATPRGVTRWIHNRHLIEMPDGSMIEHDVIWTTRGRWARLPYSSSPGWFTMPVFGPFVLAFRIVG